MNISVIIVSYNTRDLTIQCIDSVYRYTRDVSFEVILVDNASTDGTVAAVAGKYPEVRIISNEENLGFGRANNQGMRIAEGTYYFLLNSDAYLIDNALSSFYAYMERPENAAVGVAGGALLSGGSHEVCSYGNFPGIKEQLWSLGLHLVFKRYFNRHIAGGVVNYDDKVKVVDYLIGADMFIRKSVLDEVGLFDEDFFMYFEETELSRRIQHAGYPSVLLPFIRLVHLEGGSGKKENQTFDYRKFTIFSQSRTRYFQKVHGRIYAWCTKILLIIRLFTIGLLTRDGSNPFRKARIILKS